MKPISLLASLSAILIISSCSVFKSTLADASKATIVKEGLINCFESGLTASGQPVYCEASAIVYDGKNVLFANDKDMPDKRSSVFYWPFANGFADTTKPVQYVVNGLLKNAKKFEDFAITPDRKLVFLATGFDRIKPGTTEWNGFNTILYWTAGNESSARVLSFTNNDSTSVYLREQIARVLATSEFPAGMPYFKIEGLAATKDMLYLGVREEGKKFDDFKYKTKILSVKYSVNNGNIQIGNEFKVSDMNMTALQPSPNQPLAISSIEFDPFNNRFLILTSYELGEKHGGYLWTATRQDLENNRMTLVRNALGKPLEFNFKSEDIAVINKKRILIIHDDDRTLVKVGDQTRKPNQAAFSIVDFK